MRCRLNLGRNIMDAGDWKIEVFSAGDFFCSDARRRLEDRYFPLTIVTDEFDRKSVSFQLSKNEALYGWLKFKEGFSAELVRKLLAEFRCDPDDTILDPFMGSGTTALAAALNNMNSVGYDVLPMSKIAVQAKSSVLEYDLAELEELIDAIGAAIIPSDYVAVPNELVITKDAYPARNSTEIAFFAELISGSDYSDLAKNLYTLCALNSLEQVSYTAKDGQYLRWDCRCPKIVEAERKRLEAGKKPFAVKLNKGEIPSFRDTVLTELRKVVRDIAAVQADPQEAFFARCDVAEGSSIFNLPLLADHSVDAVISSPPYCNRYDYTRTYALELAYLGVTDDRIKQLRQELLSCTVENKSKRERIRDFYIRLGKGSDFERVERIIADCAALTETIAALKARSANGEMNNKGIVKMVEGYFYELAFIFYEIFRVVRPGAGVAFVNDNVRYAGEVVQVDFITCALAEAIGFEIKKIYALRQQKGNSSQQMKKYGRVALRKSITVWKKPIVEIEPA